MVLRRLLGSRPLSDDESGARDAATEPAAAVPNPWAATADVPPWEAAAGQEAAPAPPPAWLMDRPRDVSEHPTGPLPRRRRRRHRRGGGAATGALRAASPAPLVSPAVEALAAVPIAIPPYGYPVGTVVWFAVPGLEAGWGIVERARAVGEVDGRPAYRYAVRAVLGGAQVGDLPEAWVTPAVACLTAWSEWEHACP